MKIFKDAEKALNSYSEKETYFLNSLCPYNEGKICGNWCALFYYSPEEKNKGRNLSAYVILGCKVDQKMLYVDTLVK